MMRAWPLVFAILMETACGGQPAATRLRACRVPSQLPVIELRKDAPTGARSTLRLEQLAANDPDVPRAGFGLSLPTGWRVAGGSYAIEPPRETANRGGRIFVTASGATGTASWPETSPGSQPATITVDGQLLLPPLDPSLPPTDRFKGEGMPVQVCAD